MICTDDQTTQLVAAEDAPHLCRNYNISNVCTAASRFGGINESMVWTTTIPTIETNYDFLLLSCMDDYTVNMDVSWHCINPGGEELSTGQIPLKTMTTGFGITWLVLISFFILSSIYAIINFHLPNEWLILANSGNDPSSLEPQLNYAIRYLHIALLIPPILLATSSFISSSYWRTISITGEDDSTLGLTDFLVWTFAGAAVISVALAIGRGWQVTRLRIETYEFRHIFLLCLAYILIQVSNEYVGGVFFLFLQVLLVVLLIRFLFASVSWSLRLLHTFRMYALTLARSTGISNNTNNNNTDNNDYYYEDDYTSHSLANQSLLSSSNNPNSSTTSTTNDSQFINSAYYGGYYGATVASPKPTTTTNNTTENTIPEPSTQNNDIPSSTTNRAPQLSPGYLEAIRASSSASNNIASPKYSSSNNASSVSNTNNNRTNNTRPSSTIWSRTGTSISNAYHNVVSIFSSSSLSTSTGGVYRALGSANRQEVTLYDGGLTGRQIAALRYYRSTIVGYLSVQVFIAIWLSMQDTTVPWVSYLLQELATLGVFIYLFVVFRPHSDPSQSVLYDPRGYIGTHENLLDNYNTNIPSQEQDISNSHLVIVNPDSFDSSGKVIGPVSIAQAES